MKEAILRNKDLAPLVNSRLSFGETITEYNGRRVRCRMVNTGEYVFGRIHSITPRTWPRDSYGKVVIVTDSGGVIDAVPEQCSLQEAYE